MRYTTIVDITQSQEIYRNKNTRLIYLHLCLKSGYHDYDRDMIRMSIRTLAMEAGISIAATRNAIRTLEKYQMLKREPEKWTVRKFVMDQPPTPRKKIKAQEELQKIRDERLKKQAQQDQEAERQRKYREELRKQGKNPWMVYFESKMQAAAMGDLEAQDWCRKHQAEYDDQKKQLEQ